MFSGIHSSRFLESFANIGRLWTVSTMEAFRQPPHNSCHATLKSYEITEKADSGGNIL
jgi:hypothetical protein